MACTNAKGKGSSFFLGHPRYDSRRMINHWLLLLLVWTFVNRSSPSLAEDVSALQERPIHSNVFRSPNRQSRPDRNRLAPGGPSFFSTHSANPWSRSRGRWSEFHGRHVVRAIHTSQNESYADFESRDAGMHDKAEVEHWRCTQNSYLLRSIKNLIYDDCQGSINQVVHTFLTMAWLMVLFYLLGSTASDYFSCTLEKLSDTLKLSPAVAGVTLLAVGNGAPDVFSSVAAFMSSDQSGGIGFSCILGGALFITTVVSGAVAFVSARETNPSIIPKINLVCFVRDALFLLCSSAILTWILLDAKVYIWEAALFLSLYGIYAVFVSVAEWLDIRAKRMLPADVEDSLLPKVVTESSLVQSLNLRQSLYHLDNGEFEAELLSLNQDFKARPFIARIERLLLMMYRHGIERPLALPRRLTIPVIEEERWSRSFAVASCTFGPLFVGGVWIHQLIGFTQTGYLVLGVSACIGIVLGILAFMNTETARPPSQFVWLWLGGGFFMSVMWFYIVADQVVASLEDLGVIFSINPAILGLTVLAWGNCIGDLVADLALAYGGRDGVQIAISGCYAGPLFNVVVGLGLSLVLACWKSHPTPLVITDEEGILFFIIGFLSVGLIWALVVVPLNNMKLSKGFGSGLFLLYSSFLVAGMCYAMGWIPWK